MGFWGPVYYNYNKLRNPNIVLVIISAPMSYVIALEEVGYWIPRYSCSAKAEGAAAAMAPAGAG